MRLGGPVATRRIRAFSAVLWVVGLAFVGLIGVNAWNDIARSGDPLEPLSYYDGNAWDVDNPPEATLADDGTLTVPRGGSVLRLPAEARPDGPIAISAERVTGVSIYRTSIHDEPFATRADDRDYPDNVGYLYHDDPVIITSVSGDLELWFDSEEQWVGMLGTLGTETLTSSFEGAGEQWLLYEGDLLSARLQYQVADPDTWGSIDIEIFTEAGENPAVYENAPVDTRFSWQPTPAIVMHVVPTAEGPWKISLDGATADAEAAAEAAKRAAEVEQHEHEHTEDE